MTATKVGDHIVLAVEPHPSPIKGQDGRQLYFKQIVRLLLDNGVELAGCIHCEYASENPHSIRPHLANCKAKKANEEAAAHLTERVKMAATLAEQAGPTIKAVTTGRWAEAAKLGQRPATATAKKSVAPAKKATADDTLGPLLARLQLIPKLEERIKVLQSSEESWREEAMALRARLNPLLTAMDGKPRRVNARIPLG